MEQCKGINTLVFLCGEDGRDRDLLATANCGRPIGFKKMRFDEKNAFEGLNFGLRCDIIIRGGKADLILLKGVTL